MSQKLIVFDCFGVIVDEIAPPWIERYFAPEEAARVKKEVVGPADLGEITEQEMFTRLGALTGNTWRRAQAGWMELSVVRPGMPELWRSLRQKAKVVMLSDAPGTFLHRMLEERGLSDLFDKIYVSSELHMVKPDPAFFRHVLADQGVPPEKAIMIDDRVKNVQGAESVGMQGLLYNFDTTEAFAAELERRFPL